MCDCVVSVFLLCASVYMRLCAFVCYVVQSCGAFVVLCACVLLCRVVLPQKFMEEIGRAIMAAISCKFVLLRDGVENR